MSRRRGILGGTFDPVHHGHVGAATAARDALGLDEVLLMPSMMPPHRPQAPVASPYHRFAMVALAIIAHPLLQAADDELRRTGPSFTAGTLERMHEQGFAPTELFFILGTDAFAEIGTWHRYPHVLEASHFVVVARPGATLADVERRTPELAGRLARPERIDGAALDERPRVLLVPAATPDVSSTTIRQRRRAGHQIDDLVPDTVAAYIERHGLYGPGSHPA